MNDQDLLRKRDLYQQGKSAVSELTLQSCEHAFEIEYTHNSTAIEGNPLTLRETKLVLENGTSIRGQDPRGIREVISHQKAYRYVKECVGRGLPLDDTIVKEIHAAVMQDIIVGGVYRNVDVFISGSQHTPPSPNEMYWQIKNFYADLAWKGKALSPIELAAWTHTEFVKIHPFPDGNGRTSRLIMNYQLMANGFPPISIPKEKRLDYFVTLESYAIEGNLASFAEMIAELIRGRLDCCLDMLAQVQGAGQPYTVG